MQTIDTAKDEYSKTTQHLKEELAGIRTGRANTKMVENINVFQFLIALKTFLPK